VVCTREPKGHIPPSLPPWPCELGDEPHAHHPLGANSDASIRELVVGAGFAEPSSPVLRALSPEVQNTVREQVHEAARHYRSGEGYDFPATCLNAVTY
jgi:hypothetical protein